MSINKFGISLQDDKHLHRFDETQYLERNFILNKALCLDGDNYDAKSRKIIHIADPQEDTDAVNKLYMRKNFDSLINDIKKCEEFQRDTTEKIRDLVEKTNSIEHRLNDHYKQIESLTRIVIPHVIPQ